jgi:hypothetical protein
MFRGWTIIATGLLIHAASAARSAQIEDEVLPFQAQLAILDADAIWVIGSIEPGGPFQDRARARKMAMIAASISEPDRPALAVQLVPPVLGPSGSPIAFVPHEVGKAAWLMSLHDARYAPEVYRDEGWRLGGYGMWSAGPPVDCPGFAIIRQGSIPEEGPGEYGDICEFQILRQPGMVPCGMGLNGRAFSLPWSVLSKDESVTRIAFFPRSFESGTVAILTERAIVIAKVTQNRLDPQWSPVRLPTPEGASAIWLTGLEVGFVQAGAGVYRIDDGGRQWNMSLAMPGFRAEGHVIDRATQRQYLIGGGELREVGRYRMMRIRRLDDQRRLAKAGTYAHLLQDGTPALPLVLTEEQRAGRHRRVRELWSIDSVPWVLASSMDVVPLDAGRRRDGP